MLFHEPKTNSWTRNRTDSTSLWLRSENSEYANRARKLINDWYASFPDTEGKMAKKLLSDDDIQFFQALDELFVHSLLIQRWETVAVELGSSTKPDFTCLEKDVVACVIEVASLFELEDWRINRRNYDQFSDAINRLIEPNQKYGLGFRPDNPRQFPPIRRFLPWLERTLSSLPSPDSKSTSWIERRFEDKEFGGLTTIFIPMVENQKNPKRHIVALGPQIGGLIKTDDRLRDRVDKKAASKYAIPIDVPYMVAVSIRDFVVERDSPKYACYGSLQMLLPSGDTKNGRDGLFGFDGNTGKGKEKACQPSLQFRTLCHGVKIFHL